MTVLCSDRTSLLTKDKITLCDHLDAVGKSDSRLFHLAYQNAAHHSSNKNSIDAAILNMRSLVRKLWTLARNLVTSIQLRESTF